MSYSLFGQRIQETYQRLLQITSGNTIVDGNGNAIVLSISALSGGTIFSGTTNLYDIFQTIGTPSTQSYIQPGINITTGGTFAFPTVNIVNSPSFNNISFSGTSIGSKAIIDSLSASTIFSGTTDLYNIFSTIIGSGRTYTPIYTNVSNLDALTGYTCQFIVYESACTVSGKVRIDPTNIATSTKIGISLPIPSNFLFEENCAGTSYSPDIAAQGAAILADIINNRAELKFISSDLSEQDMFFNFTYIIIN